MHKWWIFGGMTFCGGAALQFVSVSVSVGLVFMNVHAFMVHGNV
jgi:hypothetical protein